MAPRFANKQRVLDIRKKDPLRKAIDIAQEVGISRERVRQLLNELGLPTNLKNPKKIYLCSGCGRSILYTQRRTMLCAICKIKSNYQLVTCQGCGEQFPRRNCVVRTSKKRGYEHVFCSYSCNGKHNAAQYGFQKGGNPKAPRKHGVKL